MFLCTNANSFEKQLFFERCDVIEFSWSRLPYFMQPMKILMKINSFHMGNNWFKVFFICDYIIFYRIYSGNFRGKSTTCCLLLVAPSSWARLNISVKISQRDLLHVVEVKSLHNFRLSQKYSGPKELNHLDLLPIGDDNLKGCNKAP